MPTSRRHAFTLIELLIVVAIIGILAAIAVPNFLNAQIRAKVARVHAEMKTCATAMESYRLDHNYYPFYLNPKDRDPEPHFLPIRLTTPVAYLGSLFDELFPARNAPDGIPPVHEFHYFNRRQSPVKIALSAAGYFQREDGRGPQYEWFVSSHGPDTLDNELEAPYDASNGLTSIGDIAQFGP